MWFSMAGEWVTAERALMRSAIINLARGVARVMNMCTHNAWGTDLRSFFETGREWIFPNMRTRRGSGGPPPRKN